MIVELEKQIPILSAPALHTPKRYSHLQYDIAGSEKTPAETIG